MSVFCIFKTITLMLGFFFQLMWTNDMIIGVKNVFLSDGFPIKLHFLPIAGFSHVLNGQYIIFDVFI